MAIRIRHLVLLVLPLAASGCVAPGGTESVDSATSIDQTEALKTLLPESIEIVEPFTTWSDFDGDRALDGLSVYVQPLNATGDPVYAAGSVFLEMYEFRNASGERRGRRIGIWDFALQTESDQQTRWNRATQMYELPIAIDRSDPAVVPGSQFVLVATLNAPLGDRLFDELVVEAPLASGAFLSRN